MRKVLSFVLVLTLVLGSFSMAFAATPAAAGASGLSDITGNANEDAIQVAYDLGIVTGNPDGTFLPAKAVTRAEFAAMITRALAVPESALAGYTATTFKDTTGYGWAVPYLAFAQSKGILLGDGAGNVMPGRTINTNEAMTMVLRAIGYTSNSSELVGSWPSNYVTLGQNLGLYDDVAAVLNVDKANAAQIIYNVLTVQKVSVNADGDTKALTIGSTTEAAVLLNTGLDCETKTGKILGASGYSYDDAKFNIVPSIGAHGDAYVNSDGDVVAFSKDSVALTGKVDSANSAKFKANGVVYTFTDGATISSQAAVIANGVEKTPSTIGTELPKTETGYVTINVDLSGKNIKQIYSIVTWSADKAEKVTADDLAAIADDNSLLGTDFDTKDDVIKANSFELVGAKSLSDIKADSIVYVYGDPIRKIAVGTEKVTGKVTQKDGDTITVNGKDYDFYDAAGQVEPPGVAASSVADAGDSVDLVLDANGYIYDCDATGTADSFGVMKGIDIQSGTIDDSRLKLYLPDDSSKTFTLASGTDMTFNGTAGAALPWAGTAVTDQAIVKYGLDKDGVINNIETSKYDTATTAALDSASVIKIGLPAKSYPVASDCVVFTWDGNDYGVTTVSNLALKTELAYDTNNTFSYVTDKDGYVVALVVKKAAASKNADDLYAVVSKITGTVDANDDPVQRIQGFADGAALDKVTTSNTAYAKATTLGAATVVKLTLDSDGNIKTSAGAVLTAGNTTISGINADKTAIKFGSTWYALAKNVKVYEVVTKTNDTAIDTFKVSSVSALRSAANYTAMVYDMDNTSDDSEGYEVVVFVKY